MLIKTTFWDFKTLKMPSVNPHIDWWFIWAQNSRLEIILTQNSEGIAPFFFFLCFNAVAEICCYCGPWFVGVYLTFPLPLKVFRTRYFCHYVLMLCYVLAWVLFFKIIATSTWNIVSIWCMPFRPGNFPLQFIPFHSVYLKLVRLILSFSCNFLSYFRLSVFFFSFRESFFDFIFPPMSKMFCFNPVFHF